MEIRRGLRFLVLSACVGALLFSQARIVSGEELLVKNPANSDVWGNRTTSQFLGKLSKDTVPPGSYSYDRRADYAAAQSFKLKSDAGQKPSGKWNVSYTNDGYFKVYGVVE